MLLTEPVLIKWTSIYFSVFRYAPICLKFGSETTDVFIKIKLKIKNNNNFFYLSSTIAMYRQDTFYYCILVANKYLICQVPKTNKEKAPTFMVASVSGWEEPADDNKRLVVSGELIH